MRACIHKFCFAIRLDALARAATNPECCGERDSFSELLVQLVQRFAIGTAMRREQRRHHVVLYVAPDNRMRCRLNRDSVHDTLHEQPPLHHSIDMFFPRDTAAHGRTFVGRRLNFRHAGTHSSRAVRSAKLGKKLALYTSRSVLREHLRGGQEGT